MNSNLYEPFVKNTKSIFMSMGNVEVNFGPTSISNEDETISLGVTSIISYTGKMKGRFMIDMEEEVALALAHNITGTYYTTVRDDMVMATVSEINNIIAGHAISEINNIHSLKLWLAPPIVFNGKKAVICIPKVNSSTVTCFTKYGNMVANIAFERSVGDGC
jgi:chemotaxis protein CheX